MEDRKQENTKEIIVDNQMVDEFISEVLKLEQENLYIKKHGLKEEILKLIKSRVR